MQFNMYVRQARLKLDFNDKITGCMYASVKTDRGTRRVFLPSYTNILYACTAPTRLSPHFKFVRQYFKKVSKPFFLLLVPWIRKKKTKKGKDSVSAGDCKDLNEQRERGKVTP